MNMDSCVMFGDKHPWETHYYY